MAVFYSDLGFNIASVDFHAPLEGRHVYSAEGATTFSLPDIPVSLGGTALTVPGFDLSVGGQLTVNWGRDSLSAVMGDRMEFDRGGAILSGTARVLVAQNAAGVDYALAGFALPAAAYGAAMHTAGRADDRAYLARALSGNDLVWLSGFADGFNSGAGQDVIVDRGGSDSILSGAGADIVLAGTGDDSVAAGLGDDIVLGQAGLDTLRGNDGDDTLWGGAGNDSMAGGAGADMFLFAQGDGNDTVAGFAGAEDQLVFLGAPSGLLNLRLSQVGADTLVRFSDVSVLLLGVDKGSLDLSDITLGTQAQLAAAVTGYLDGWSYTA